jgi:hypothetical protein
MGHQLERLTHCLNCGTETSGNFCANCGQENEDQTASIKAVAEDFLDDVIHFDSRLVRTAVPLVFKPGFLTTEYNAGKRVSYLSPYRMYLFVSGIFFILFAYYSSLPSTHLVTSSTTSTSSPAARAAEKAKDNAARAAAIQALKQANIAIKGQLQTKHYGPVTVNIDSQDINSIVNNAVNQTQKSDDDDGDVTSIGTSRAKFGGHNIDLSTLPKTVAAYEYAQSTLPPRKRDSLWEHNLKTNIITYRADPDVLKAKLIDEIPKMTFFLVPLYAASLYPMYVRRKRFYVEHLIYSLHTHAFVFVVFTLMLLLNLPFVSHMTAIKTEVGIVQAILIFTIPIYLFISLKKVYGQSVMKTLLKFGIAWSNYWILLGTAFAVIVGITLFFPQ